MTKQKPGPEKSLDRVFLVKNNFNHISEDVEVTWSHEPFHP